jgi:hypothetical protein
MTLLGCEKDDILQKTDKLNIAQEPSLKAAYIVPDNFEWENETFITYRGANIVLPWASGSNSSNIPKEICDDFLKSSGWELLYNDFPLGQTDPKFMLYNKFTGIVKVYMYITSTTYQGNTFTWGLGSNTINCQTSIFNFTKNRPEPITRKYINPSVYVANYSSDPIARPNGINAGHWYSAQFEMMYDPNITSLSHSNIDLRLQCFSSKQEYIKLQGNIAGVITGTFSIPNSGGSSGVFSDAISSFSVNKVGKINMPTLDESKKYLTGYIAQQTDSYLKSKLTQGLSALASSLTTTNPILTVLTGGLFSTKSSSLGKIDCSLNATIKQAGIIEANYSGPGAIFKFPGTSNSNLGGLLPNYDKPLGVFCITKTPIVKRVQTSSPYYYDYETGEYLMSCSNAYDIDFSSFEVKINPEVIASCSDVKISKNIVFSPCGWTASSISGGELVDSSNGYHTYLSGDDGHIEESFEYQDNALSGVAVRIAVFMTPKGQSDPIIVVKEFHDIAYNDTYINL